MVWGEGHYRYWIFLQQSMSITTDEVNYLIWRYFQEAGLEISAYALDDETDVHTLDATYEKHVPLGCLIDLIQKGILYSKMKSLVESSKTQLDQDDLINMNFNFFTALHEIKENETANERSIMSTDDGEKLEQGKRLPEEEQGVEEEQQKDDEGFIRVIKEYKVLDPSNSISFSPTSGGTISLAHACNTQTDIVDIETNTAVTLPASPLCKEVLLAQWSSNGQLLITAYENGELRLWSSQGALVTVFAMHHWPIVALEWSHNNKYLISIDIRNIVIVWDITTKTIAVHLDKENWKNLTNFSLLVNTVDDSIQNFGTTLCWLDDTKFITPGPNYSLLVNQLVDSKHSIVGVLIGHEESVCAINYNKDLRLLCSASEDGIIRIFKGNSTNSLQVLSGHSLAITYLEWIKLDDKWYILSTSLDGTIRIWDFINNQTLAISCIADGQPILYAASHVSPDKEVILATGDSSASVSIWNISCDKIKQVGLYQHGRPDGHISHISWNLDGTKFAAAFTKDKSVIIKV